jgi:hypothetical protein
MANTVVAMTALTAGTAVADVAGTAIDAANTVVITPTKRFSKVIIRLANTFAGTKVATIKAGANPPASSAGVGDYAITMADATSATTITFVAGLESARYLQADGSIHITFAASTTGFVTAFQL